MPAKSDKLFQRRRGPIKADLQRKKATQEPRKRFLIICEGEVTEPNYFEAFKAFARLVNVDVDVCGKECGSAPISIVNFAVKKANSEGHYASGGYDEVYCVFDRDTHETFEQAMSKTYSLNKSNKLLARCIKAFPSYPCFEIWLLFHFSYTRAPFRVAKGKSPADLVLSKLKKASPMFTDYEKALSSEQCMGLFRRLHIATLNAERACEDAKQTGELSPSTTIHEMLARLHKANDWKSA